MQQIKALELKLKEAEAEKRRELKALEGELAKAAKVRQAITQRRRDSSPA